MVTLLAPWVTAQVAARWRTFSSGWPSFCCVLLDPEGSGSAECRLLLLPLLGVGAVYSCASTPCDLVLRGRVKV